MKILKNKTIRLFVSVALMAQFVIVLISSLITLERKDKGIGILIFLSSVAALAGSYLVYRDVIEPKIKEGMPEFSLDEDDEFVDYIESGEDFSEEE